MREGESGSMFLIGSVQMFLNGSVCVCGIIVIIQGVKKNL